MKILVLLAGVLDPKWPLQWPVAGSGPALPERSADRLILSPFDEAALEAALKIRDARPEAGIRAIVAGGDAATRLARAVAAFTIADVATIALSAPWDQGRVARELAGVCGGADLILIGREFGDYDDGLVPPMLAALLGWPCFGRVEAIEGADPVRLMRENGAFAERLDLDGRLLASLTNSRHTRLRKPLMKNVMMARQASIRAIEPAGSVTAHDAALELAAAHELAGVRAEVECRFMAGSLEAQAEQIAARLVAEL